ncbi:SDR family oxidoreductase [Rhizobium sp. GCM10022189]|uniref:SDR family oxidoreductase n=1 Tax=Rhizobium sp. GCM10022189 TaxID=3252654 RepID=UPI003612CC55
MDLQFGNRVVVVTGGSSGIGLATVRMLLAEGAKVVTCSRDWEKLERSVSDLEASGLRTDDNLLAVSCDVTDEVQTIALARQVRARFGGADVLINNAGQGRYSTFETTTDEDWEAEMRLKLYSIVRPTRALLPMLRESDRASIVVVNALLARQPAAHMVCTSAARASVLNLVKSMSFEFAPAVRINSVLVDSVNSGQWERRFAQRENKQQSKEEWLRALATERQIPLNRMGLPEEVAAAICFLASPVSGFTTGASLEVSGGLSKGV